jgi:hypothetical protein
MDDKMLEKLRLEFPTVSEQDMQQILKDLDQYEKLSAPYKSKRKKNLLNKKERDAVCDLWLEVFGVQEGVGRNCPAGAYKFAKLLTAAKDKEIADLYTMCLTQAKTIKEYQDARENS